MKPNTGEVLRVITWLVGFFVVYMVPKHMENHYVAVARTSYVTIPLIWFTVLAGFILGAYVPLIFVRRWAFHPNWPMLAIVFLPFALLSLYVPMSMTFSWPMPFHIGIRLAPYFELFPMIAGFGLVSGILGHCR
ncbi:hypothetical protein [Kyrpidia tusciae]|uniref:hypothetical protein n=1 Tax=Kyrpidia tusciae TaxID=33943 RepID=UPI000F50AA81|nr:hypothetical protein [Kyrpidia tusciae]